ncbi:MAG TPA: glycosyltransferase family 39 protein [Roseimicrobium sp.]|nr:glycosyltransferase family 39 protein [Roseimicrobium sp.]
MIRSILSRLPRIPWFPAALAFALIFAITVAFQRESGAFQSEMGAEPDEAAHYVTGLMMRDYVAAGCPGNPLAFAKKYYEHYPKVALGHWPPGFYVAQTLWTLPFGPGRASILVFMAALTGALGSLLFLILRRDLGNLWAITGAVILAMLPLTYQHAGMVMTEIPIALLVLLGAFFYGLYLEREQPLDSVLYGVIAAAALLTKFSALSLAFVPVIGILLTRKFHLLRKASFWAPVAIVLMTVGPWTAFTLKLAKDGMMEEKPSVAFLLHALKYFSLKLTSGASWIIIVFAAAGVFASFRKNGKAVAGRHAALVALPVGVIVLHAAVPAGLEARHLVPALAAVIYFAIFGADFVTRKVAQFGPPGGAQKFICFLLLGIGLVHALPVKPKGYAGFEPVAMELLNEAAVGKVRALVVSDARGEGMLVSEAAVRDRKRTLEIKRASKLLAESNWNGGAYTARAANTAEAVRLLKTEGIQYVVIDRTIPERLKKTHHEVLSMAVGDTQFFTEKSRHEITRAGRTLQDGILVYTVK